MIPRDLLQIIRPGEIRTKSLALVMLLPLSLLLPSCATKPHPTVAVVSPERPADVTMNEDAGRGNLLFVTLRLETGEELPFFVDTGSTFTSFDQSLESKLGKPFGKTSISSWGGTQKAVSYAAPRLYLGNMRLMTGRHVYIGDFKKLSAQACRPIMGVLGMDCLHHYCLQLDFGAGQIHFLDSVHLDDSELGTAYRLAFRSGCAFIHQGNLVGEQGTNLLVDAGYRGDGALESGLFEQAVREHRSKGTAVSGQHAGRLWFSHCSWNGGNYTNLLIGNGGTNFLAGQGCNAIGLRFLARHLVTFDFPRQTLYLKQISVGPLEDERMKAAREFLDILKGEGRLPGWSVHEEGTLYREAYPDFEAFDGRKNGESSVYHYQVSRASEGGAWKLQKAWRTDQEGRTVEEFPGL